MQIRFIMYPGEMQLSPIYKRIFATPVSARVLVVKRLISYAFNTNTIPKWFWDMREDEIETTRSQTVRITLSEKDIEYKKIYQDLLPLSGAGRVYRLKEILVANLNSKTDATASQAVIQSPKNTPVEPTIHEPAPLQKLQSIDANQEEKMKLIRSGNRFFSPHSQMKKSASAE